MALSDARLLDGRVAVVTGSGRGIGRAIAELFVQQGARVVINDVDDAAAEEAASSCQAIGGAECVALHVGAVHETVQAEALMRRAVEAHGQLDILVNNAGITRDAMVHKMSDEDWRSVIDVNLGGTFACTRATVPYMRDRAKDEIERLGSVQYHRKVINFFSTSAIHGNVGQSNYAAAKLGNVGFTRSVAREWSRFHINVNCVAPGFTDTRLTKPKEEGSDGLGIPGNQRNAMLERLPFGRPAAPDDIARVVLFLSSPMSDWVTGQAFNISGGQQIP